MTGLPTLSSNFGWFIRNQTKFLQSFYDSILIRLSLTFTCVKVSRSFTRVSWPGLNHCWRPNDHMVFYWYLFLSMTILGVLACTIQLCEGQAVCLQGTTELSIIFVRRADGLIKGGEKVMVFHWLILLHAHEMVFSPAVFSWLGLKFHDLILLSRT